MSKKKTAIQTTLFIVLTGAVTGILTEWGTHWVGPRREVNEPPDGPSLEELLSESSISLLRWQNLVDELVPVESRVRERIFRDYLGDRVVWEGYVDQVHQLPRGKATKQNAATMVIYDSLNSLNSEQLLGPPFVRCWFSQAEREQLAQLDRGQKVVVRGTLANPTLIGSALATDLSKCEVVAVEDEFLNVATRSDAQRR